MTTGIRFVREWQLLTEEPTCIPGLTLTQKSDDGVMPVVWKIELAPDMPFLKGTVYAGEAFDLEVKLDDMYPRSAAQLVFKDKIPAHPHIYCNGFICMEPLYRGWSASSTVRSALLSVLVMLADTKLEDKVPPERDIFASWASHYTDPRTMSWMYHDDFSSKVPAADDDSATGSAVAAAAGAVSTPTRA